MMEKEFKKVGTHDGKFHADEVMATAILNQIFEIQLVRTRDKTILDNLDIVYDVNGGELDHHGINKVLREDGIPYSSCGLVWKKFGKDIIKFKDEKINDEDSSDIFDFVDKGLLEGIDALDNGVWIDKSDVPLMNVSSILSGFNPVWYEQDKENENFNKAVKFAEEILNNKINFKNSVLKAKEKVMNAYKVREIPQVVILDTYCPYIEALKEADENQEILYVIFKTKTNYILQTVRGKDGEDRKKLPKSWAGKRDEELQNETKVSDAIFCHSARFIAVAASLEGIKKLAVLSINAPYEHKSIISKIIKSIMKLFSKK